MPFGAPNVVPDMTKHGEDMLWQEVEYYLTNMDDHTMSFERSFFCRIVPFLYYKAKAVQPVRRTLWQRVYSALTFITLPRP